MERIIEHRRNIFKKYITISLKLLIIFSSLAAYKYVEYFRDNQETWLKIFIIVALVFLIIKYIHEEKIIWIKTSLNLPILIFISIMSLSLLVSQNLIVSIKDYIIFLSYFLIYFLVINNIENKRDFYSFINLFYLITFIVAIYTLVQYYGLDPYFNDLTSTIGQKNLVSNYLALTFPMIFSFFLLEEIQKNKILLFFLLSIIYTTIMICQSRGIWISISLTLIFAIYIVVKFNIFEIFKKNKKWLITILFTFLIITIIYSTDNPINKSAITVPQRALSTFDEQDPSINTRILMWRTTFEMIKDKPIFGSGIGTFKMNYLDYQAEFLKNNPEYIKYWAFPRDAHNEYLQIGAELGLLGLIFYIIVIINFFSINLRYLIEERNMNKKLVCFGLMIGGFSFLIHSLFTFPLRVPPLGSAFFILLSLSTIYSCTKGFTEEINDCKMGFIELTNFNKNDLKIIIVIIVIIMMFIAINFLAIRPFLSQVYSYKGKYNVSNQISNMAKNLILTMEISLLI